MKGEFLGLAVVAVLLQVAYGELLQGKGSLQTDKTTRLSVTRKAFVATFFHSLLFTSLAKAFGATP